MYQLLMSTNSPSPSTSEDDEFHDLRKKVDEVIYNNKNKGYKSSKRLYRKVFNTTMRQSTSIDKFGENYFYTKKEDVTISICITLPKSLVEEINKYCAKKELTRSRLIRKLCEYGLNLKKD